MWLTTLILSAVLVQSVTAFYNLRQLSYTQLATSKNNRGEPVYGGLNLGTATDAAYDFVNNIVYVIGETSHFMHVIDIAVPSNPRVLFVHEFTKGEGIPLAIDICGNEIAVALAAQTDTNEGHVRFYHTYTKGSGATDVVLDGYVTVGPHPSHLKYTRDCGSIVVANEGLAGKDEAGAYIDPQGSVTVINGEKTGNPSVRLVDFGAFNLGQPSYNANIRTPSLYIPSSVLSPLTTVAQDIEPEYVTISTDGRTAYVTLQENNAIAEIDIIGGTVRKVTPVSRKSWSAAAIDSSSRDGGVHRRMYPGLYSLRQPGVIKSWQVGNKRFLITADEGASKTYTSAQHKFDWTDKAMARTLGNSIEPTQVTLKANALDDEMLGRLEVSTIDGKNMFSQMYEQLNALGGRGFSIWDTASLATPVFDSEGTLEEYMEAFKKEVFNTDYVPSLYYQSPEQHRDTVSDDRGARVTAMDIADDNGTVFLVVGTWSTGTLFLYTVDTASGIPAPQFRSIFRAGTTDLPWRDMYQNQTVGDLYIKDIGIIPSDHSPIDAPLLYVVSTGSGSLSIYAIEEQTAVIPGPV